MSTILNTPEEKHALIIGLSEVICPWPPRLKLCPDYLRDEYHYYLAGRALAMVIWLIIALAMTVILR